MNQNDWYNGSNERKFKPNYIWIHFNNESGLFRGKEDGNLFNSPDLFVRAQTV